MNRDDEIGEAEGCWKIDNWVDKYEAMLMELNEREIYRGHVQ